MHQVDADSLVDRLELGVMYTKPVLCCMTCATIFLQCFVKWYCFKSWDVLSSKGEFFLRMWCD